MKKKPKKKERVYETFLFLKFFCMLQSLNLEIFGNKKLTNNKNNSKKNKCLYQYITLH